VSAWLLALALAVGLVALSYAPALRDGGRVWLPALLRGVGHVPQWVPSFAGAREAVAREAADVVGAVVDHTHLENADVRNVRVLERFSFVEVPQDRAGEVVEKVTGKRVRGAELRLEVARKR